MKQRKRKPASRLYRGIVLERMPNGDILALTPSPRFRTLSVAAMMKAGEARSTNWNNVRAACLESA